MPLSIAHLAYLEFFRLYDNQQSMPLHLINIYRAKQLAFLTGALGVAQLIDVQRDLERELVHLLAIVILTLELLEDRITP